MIKTVKLFCGFMAIAVLAFVASCSDDPAIGGGGSVPVADGYYFSADGVNPVEAGQLKSEKVEDDDFASQDREGFFANYMYLTAGDYYLVQVIDQEVANVFTDVLVDTTARGVNDDGSACELAAYLASYNVTDTAESVAPAFVVPESGFYKVFFDLSTSELLVDKIENFSVIGGFTSWAHDAGFVLTPVGVPSASLVKFEGTGLTFKQGEWKVRYNCKWKIDRRLDTEAGHLFANGYVANSNFGGTLDAIEAGGGNFVSAFGDDGEYRVTLTWTPNDGVSVETENQVPSLPKDPATFAWGITGNATTADWPADNGCPAADEDIDLTYSLDGTIHKYTGTFTLVSAGAFKFRANDCWDINFGFSAVSAISGTKAANVIDSDGNFAVDTDGSYTFVLSTANGGETWQLKVD